MTATAAQIDENLKDLRTALEVDGYRLSVTGVSADTLALNIDALSNACPDCLVPSPVMELIVRAAIPSNEQFTSVTISYPIGSASDD